MPDLRFVFRDAEQPGVVRADLARGCEGNEGRYSVSVEPGRYTVLVRGLDAQGRVCYELSQTLAFQSGQTRREDLVVPAHPEGTAQGCRYPGQDAGATMPDAGLVSCRNLDARGQLDPVRDCLVEGTWCAPEEGAPDATFGTCQPGDDCDFIQQTGCPNGGTCHPFGAFGYDNTRGRFCESAAQQGGSHLMGCTRVTDCARGYTCVRVSDTQAACLRYCTPGRTTGAGTCTGIGGQDGGVARCVDLGQGQPDSISSIPVGVCL